MHTGGQAISISYFNFGMEWRQTVVIYNRSIRRVFALTRNWKSACSACHRCFVGWLGIAGVFTDTAVPSSTNWIVLQTDVNVALFCHAVSNGHPCCLVREGWAVDGKQDIYLEWPYMRKSDYKCLALKWDGWFPRLTVSERWKEVKGGHCHRL